MTDSNQTTRPEEEASANDSLPNAAMEGSKEIEEVLQQILLLPGNERSSAVEEYSRTHPEKAAKLRKRYEILVDMELVTRQAQGKEASDMSSPGQIGPYRILEVLGEGGMGTVYLAEQKKPIRRRVALKLIKRGMDSKLVLRRFEAERQALARMEHDNIAKVHDAGCTDDGRPYFIMEYVKGLPWRAARASKGCDPPRHQAI